MINNAFDRGFIICMTLFACGILLFTVEAGIYLLGLMFHWWPLNGGY